MYRLGSRCPCVCATPPQVAAAAQAPQAAAPDGSEQAPSPVAEELAQVATNAATVAAAQKQQQQEQVRSMTCSMGPRGWQGVGMAVAGGLPWLSRGRRRARGLLWKQGVGHHVG